MGERTQRFGEEIEAHLVKQNGATPEKAREVARAVAKVFGKVAELEKSKGGTDKSKHEMPTARTAQLAFIGPEERKTAIALAESMVSGLIEEVKADQVLKRADTAVDIAMFGRMLADNADFNREAAVQVAHLVMDVIAGTGSLAEVKAFVAEA